MNSSKIGKILIDTQRKSGYYSIVGKRNFSPVFFDCVKAFVSLSLQKVMMEVSGEKSGMKYIMFSLLGSVRRKK